MPNLYIIAGCNGAGKTTASFTILPEILNCKEFVNADSIAAGLSPFNPESVAFEAGRIMLHRMNQLIAEKIDFAFETTLATRSYVSLIKKAQAIGYEVTLLFFWLNSPELAMKRVAERVRKGGHNIPVVFIKRRYYRGISNLQNLYIPICNNWAVVNNVDIEPAMIAQGGINTDNLIQNPIFGMLSYNKVSDMENKSTNFTELSEKLLQGIRKALRKLVETSAANGESLVIGDRDGKIKTIPAKDLLESLPK